MAALCDKIINSAIFWYFCLVFCMPPIRINYSFDIYYAYSILNLEPLSEELTPMPLKQPPVT